jgi:gluconokinase
LTEIIHEPSGPTTVLACSALKVSYRRALASGERTVVFVHLDVPAEELNRRLNDRANHFAGASLLESQWRTWQPPEASEDLVQLSVDGVGTPEQVLGRVLSLL